MRMGVFGCFFRNQAEYLEVGFAIGVVMDFSKNGDEEAEEELREDGLFRNEKEVDESGEHLPDNNRGGVE
jgi:hypothetical protein